MIKPKTKKIEQLRSEVNCYKCFKIMILNLLSSDQEGPVNIYGRPGGGPRDCSENIHQHCMYLALTACVLYLLLV